jgi:hypothetical protein
MSWGGEGERERGREGERQRGRVTERGDVRKKTYLNMITEMLEMRHVPQFGHTFVHLTSYGRAQEKFHRTRRCAPWCFMFTNPVCVWGAFVCSGGAGTQWTPVSAHVNRPHSAAIGSVGVWIARKPRILGRWPQSCACVWAGIHRKSFPVMSILTGPTRRRDAPFQPQ